MRTKHKLKPYQSETSLCAITEGILKQWDEISPLKLELAKYQTNPEKYKHLSNIFYEKLF